MKVLIADKMAPVVAPRSRHWDVPLCKILPSLVMR